MSLNSSKTNINHIINRLPMARQKCFRSRLFCQLLFLASLVVLYTVLMFYNQKGKVHHLLDGGGPPSVDSILHALHVLVRICKIPAFLSTYGESHRHRPLHLLRIGGNNSQPTVLLTSGMHGREFQGPLAALLAVESICRSPSMLHNVTLLVAPITNPDGYERSRTVLRPARKTWPIHEVHCDPPKSDGVDLNRNFPVGWTLVHDPCSATYGGKEALSEPEAVALTTLVRREKNQLRAHLDIHSFGALLFHGRGIDGVLHDDTKHVLEVQRSMARAVRFAVRQRTGIDYADWSATVDPLSGQSRTVGGLFMDFVTSIGVPSLVMELGPKWTITNRANGFFEGKHMARQRGMEVKTAVSVLLDVVRDGSQFDENK